MSNESAADRAFLDRTLALAAQAYGETSPNPLVGAVVTHQERVLGEAFHPRAGAPHAEPQALAQALASSIETAVSHREWTLYVNLEPCTHQGRTPPCVEAILQSPVRRVVVPLVDPDPRVAGRGIATLRAAGLQVDFGCRAAEAAELNHVFIGRQRRGRPFVALKVALSADGCISRADGRPTQITGAEAQRHAHRLRAGLDAILIGVETLRRDRPRLDRRFYAGPGRAPRRLVIDPELRTEPEWLWPGEAPAVVFCSRPARDRRGARFAGRAELLSLPAGRSGLDLHALVEGLPELGVWSLLVEGGGRTHREFLAEGLWDRFYLYRNPGVELDGLYWVASDLWAGAAAGLEPLHREDLGADRLTVYAHPDSLGLAS